MKLSAILGRLFDHGPAARTTQPRRGSRVTVEALEDRWLPSVYSYLVVANSDSSLPAHFAQRIHDAGGEVRSTVPQIGVAIADSSDPAFKARADHIPG